MLRLALLTLLWASLASARETPAMKELSMTAGSVSEAPAPPVRAWVAPADVQSEIVDGVQIVGSAEFIAATKKALALIATSFLRKEVFAALGRIEEAPCSGMDVRALRPTFNVGEPTWRGDTQWYAGAIVHDSRHSQLFTQASLLTPGLEPDPSAWEGASGEKLALAYQIRFLRLVHASRERLAYLKKLEADPRYQEIGEPKAAVPFDPRAHYRTSLACDGRNW